MATDSDEAEWVRGSLRSVLLPGSQRNIVAAGFIKDIEVEDARVTVHIAPNTRNLTKVEQMEADIRDTLGDDGRFERIEVQRHQPFAGTGALSTDGRVPPLADRDVKLKGLANMITAFSKRWRVPVLGVLMSFVWLGPIHHVEAAETGQEIFESLCAACHTIGKGKLVGPDLAGVTSRREESWLHRQIKEPDALLAENDPIAMQLLQEADDVEMPPLDLSDEEVVAVIAYLKSTEQQGAVATGRPSQYLPTVLLSLMLLIGLTLIGLRAGSKKVDVR